MMLRCGLLLSACAVLLLSWHLLEPEQSVCGTRTLWNAESGEGYSRFLGTKTPYSLLRQMKGEASAVQDQLGCKVIKVRARINNGDCHASFGDARKLIGTAVCSGASWNTLRHYKEGGWNRQAKGDAHQQAGSAEIWTWWECHTSWALCWSEWGGNARTILPRSSTQDQATRTTAKTLLKETLQFEELTDLQNIQEVAIHHLLVVLLLQ